MDKSLALSTSPVDTSPAPLAPGVEKSVGLDTSRSPFSAALRRLWWLVGLMGLIGVVVGLAFGFGVHQTYSSSSQFLVGTPAVTAEAVPGYVAATQSLAQSYSRAAETPALFVPVAKRFGVSESTASQRLSISPLPSSNIVTLTATGRTAKAARLLATVAGNRFLALVRKIQHRGVGSSGLSSEYAAATSKLLKAQSALSKYRRSHPGLVGQATKIGLETSVSLDQLQVTALTSQYVQAQAQSLVAAGMSRLSPASVGAGNKSSIAEKAALIGLLGGLVIGAFLSFLIETARRNSHDAELA